MRVGKRLFPYPVLNNNKQYSQYKNSTLSLEYNEVITDEYLILDNIRCNIDCNYMKAL